MSTASALKGRRRRTQQDGQPSSRDASEEDNDDSLSSSAASTLNPPHAPRPHHGLGQSPLRQKKTTMTSRPFSDEDDTDSPGHEGDVESSSSLVRETSSYAHHPDHASSSDSSHSIDPIPRLLTPKPAELNRFADSATAATKKESPPPGGPVTQLSEADIRAFVQRALDGELEPSLGFERTYKVNQPPVGRPVRIYADGVYDLFHFGHALQMRQAKLCFPSVHLIIGVCSDELCSSHKSMPALTHTERCESVRHCKWVDEVAPDAPWEINQEFLDRYEIDYVAHDEEPYRSANKEDVYDFVKAQGRFLPTRRTPGISTSELLERIVSGYRTGKFDVKLQKIGHPELMAEKVHWK